MRITKETNKFILLKSEDAFGEYIISIEKDCSQISMKQNDDNVCIGTDYDKLKTLRDCITKVLETNI